MNASKTKTNYNKAIDKYNKVAKSQFPPAPVYKDLTGEHLQSKEKQEIGKDYAPNPFFHFLPDFKTVLCKPTKFQTLPEIQAINIKQDTAQTWYSDFYKRLVMQTYVAAIDKGLPVVKKTVGVGQSIITEMNKHLIIQNTPGGFENCAALTALRQAVGHE
eukprot:2638408-Ditylum_brightwellii.AAC.1